MYFPVELEIKAILKEHAMYSNHLGKTGHGPVVYNWGDGSAQNWNQSMQYSRYENIVSLPFAA